MLHESLHFSVYTYKLYPPLLAQDCMNVPVFCSSVECSMFTLHRAFFCTLILLFSNVFSVFTFYCSMN